MEKPSIGQRISAPLLPGIMMVFLVVCFFLTCLLHPLKVLSLDLPALQSQAFAYFWNIFGRAFANDVPSPDLDDILAKCHGLVLDLGPGAGFQVKRFARAAQTGKVKTIYGVEPGFEMHADLKSAADKAGLKDKYRILGVGGQMEQLIPALEKEGLLKGGKTEGIFDEIVCLRVLCGIPNHEATIKGLYKLLKPGGRFVIFEHVINSGDSRQGGSPLAKFMQHFYMLMQWPFWAGGCELTRDTLGVLKKAAQADGGWAKIDIHPRNPWSTVSEVYGYLIKKK